MPLEGVLRSELEPKLSSHLGKYLRDSSVRATPLLRLAVFGSVRNPGWFYIEADVLLNDAIMRAGGPNATADVSSLMIRRGGDVIWSAQDTRTALADGLSLDRLHLRAGDELSMDDQQNRSNWIQYLQLAGPLVALIGLGWRYH
jgi:protein involved in polysaccharide export with SLBB domain